MGPVPGSVLPLRRVLRGRVDLTEREATVALPANVVLDRSLLFITARVRSNEPRCAAVEGQLLNVVGGVSLWLARESSCPDGVDVGWQVAEFESGLTVERGRRLNLSSDSVTLPAADGPNGTFPIVTASSAGVLMDETDAFTVAPGSAGWTVQHFGGTALSLSWQVAHFTQVAVRHAPFVLSGVTADVEFPAGGEAQRMLTLDYAYTGPTDLPGEAAMVTAERTTNGATLSRVAAVGEPLRGHVHAIQWPDGVRVETMPVNVPASATLVAVPLVGASVGTLDRRVCLAGLLQRAGRVASTAVPTAVRQAWFRVDCVEDGLILERDEAGAEATVVVWHLVF